MDEKKVREAIKHFKHLKDVLENYLKIPNVEENLGVEIIFIKKDIEVYETVIEALEKQLPEKVKQSGVTTQDGIFHRINGINGVPYDLCPNCEVNLCTSGILGRNKKDMKYCERCGQKLDWSEE